MGRKHVSRVYKVIDGGDMSLQAVSEETVVEQFDTVSYFVKWSGTGSLGSFSIEVSNNEDKTNNTWETLDFGTILSVAQDTGSDQILIKDIHFRKIRISYNPTAGVGTLNVEIKSTTKGA